MRGLIFYGTGIPFGTMFTLAGSGIIASTYGWPSVFYVSGLAGILWAILWLVLGSDNPAHCRLISADERDYIEKYIPVNSVQGKVSFSEYTYLVVRTSDVDETIKIGALRTTNWSLFQHS